MQIRTHITWAPGQHVILRFPRLRPLESHPYSIATLPNTDPVKENVMSFVIRAQDGFSKTLLERVRVGGKLSLGVLVDGPYGESSPEFRAYDSALVLAGGTGIAHVLPIYLDIVKCMGGEGDKSRCGKVDLVWVVRTRGTLSSF